MRLIIQRVSYKDICLKMNGKKNSVSSLNILLPVQMSLIFSRFSPVGCRSSSYGRVYAADPYNHTLTPAATYSVGAMVRPNVWWFSLLHLCLRPCHRAATHFSHQTERFLWGVFRYILFCLFVWVMCSSACYSLVRLDMVATNQQPPHKTLWFVENICFKSKVTTLTVFDSERNVACY